MHGIMVGPAPPSLVLVQSMKESYLLPNRCEEASQDIRHLIRGSFCASDEYRLCQLKIRSSTDKESQPMWCAIPRKSPESSPTSPVGMVHTWEAWMLGSVMVILVLHGQ